MPSKNRTRLQRKQRARQLTESNELQSQPHSMVICRGKSGKNLNQLMLDTRKMMSPYTASSLKVKKGNVLKDFLTIAGPLNVKHILSFSKTKENVSFRLITTPKGPTMTFAVEEYVLKKDIESALKRPVRDQSLHKNSPLIIMSDFPTQTEVQKFVYEAFRSLFPRIKPSQVMVDNIRRVVLLHYDKEKDQVELRHYAIKTRSAAGRRVRKLLDGNKELPNMGKYGSIEQYLEAMSGSESEFEGSEEVQNPKTGRSMAVRLTEIGPRISLRLVKIEEGLSGGAVLYHKFKTKSEEEMAALQEKKEKKEELKEERKRIQNENVAKKEQAKQAEKKKADKEKRKEDNKAKARMEHVDKVKEGKVERHGDSKFGRKRPQKTVGGKKPKLSKKDKSSLL